MLSKPFLIDYYFRMNFISIVNTLALLPLKNNSKGKSGGAQPPSDTPLLAMNPR